MRSPWLLALVALLAALLAAHAPTLPAAVRGDVVYSYAFDRCQAHFASEAAPSPRPRPAAEGCDTIYSQRMGWDGWRRAEEAWEKRTSVARFVTVDLWRVATDARALNVLDLVLFMWPARLVFGPAGGFVALHLGLVALAAVSGFVFARTIGASPLGALAAGTVAGASGVVVESVERGQYPQAVITGALLFFAGLARVTKGERGGVALAGGGAALAALLYWQNGLILGLGAVVWLVGARIAGPFARGTVRRLAAGAVLAVALAAVPAVPVIEAIRGGTEQKVKVEPWGTPFPAASTNVDDLMDLIDEVPWFTLASPARGWLPALPLLPLALYGLSRRERAPWALLAALGLVMALGPLPPVPDGWGFRTVEGYGAVARTHNPVYELVYQWVPTASRQRHPMRWAALLTVGMAAAVAFGVDRLRGKWPDHALVAVVAGLAWVAWVGPWPLRRADFPQEVVDAFAGCPALVLPRTPAGDRDLDDLHRLEGLLWKPRSPVRTKGTGGVGSPTAGMRAWSRPYEAAMSAALTGKARLRPDPLVGTCVVFERSWFSDEGPAIRAALVGAFGEPTFTVSPTDLFAADGTTRRVEVFVPRATPTGTSGP